MVPSAKVGLPLWRVSNRSGGANALNDVVPRRDQNDRHHHRSGPISFSRGPREMHLAEATATAIVGVALSNVAPIIGPILAQANAAPDLGSWGQVASTIVSTGFAVWYAWHVTTKTLPEKDRLHQEAVKAIVDELHRDAAEARDTFKQAIADIRSGFRCQNIRGVE